MLLTVPSAAVVRAVACATFIPTCALPAAPAFVFAQTQAHVVRDVRYTTSGPAYANKKDRLDIYVPAKAHAAPVIISIHGGSLTQGDKSQQEFVGHRFSSDGFVTVVINYRLSPTVTYPAYVEDVAKAVAWVRHNIAQYGGDSTSIVVVGHSAGAYLAALLTLDERYLGANGLTSRDIRGVVPVSGFFYVDRPGVAPDRPKEIWSTDRNVWAAASPGSHVRSGLPPMLLVWADGDDEWRRNQQGEFADALKHAANANVSLHMVPGRTHDTVWGQLANPSDETARTILDFIASLPKHSAQ